MSIVAVSSGGMGFMVDVSVVLFVAIAPVAVLVSQNREPPLA